MKKWPSWLKFGIIGLIIGLIYPLSSFFGYYSIFPTILLYPVIFTLVMINPDMLNALSTATLSVPIFYMILGVLFGLISGRRKHQKTFVDSDGPYTPESIIAGFLTNQTIGSNVPRSPLGFPNCSSAELINIRVYKDPEETLANYKTFDFDYTNKTNPLLEKELFGQLEKALIVHGLTRSKENPQIAISMDFFIGKKEQYTPPTTITSTKLMYDWNFASFGGNYGGFSSTIPITSSNTTPGYTTTTYYSNIRINFLNHAKLIKGKKPEIPPMIWMGESDSERISQDIRGIAPTMFNELLDQFLNQTYMSSGRYMNHVIYGGLGLGFKTTDWRVIHHVEASSVAAEHGIKSGDYILSINRKPVGNWPTYRYPNGVISADTNYPVLYRTTDPYFTDILSNTGNKDVELVVRSAETGEKIKLKMRPRITERFVQIDPTMENITYSNPVGTAVVIIVSIVIIYFVITSFNVITR